METTLLRNGLNTAIEVSLVGDGKDGFQEISIAKESHAYRMWIRRGYALLGYGETHALEILGLIFLSN